MAPDGKTVYTTDPGYGSDSDTVTPISTATNRPGQPIHVGPFPFAIAVTPDSKTVYVASGAAGTVTPVAAATGTLGQPITVGREPQAIAITPDGKTAYVISYAAGTVTPIGDGDQHGRASRSTSARRPSPSRSPRTARPPTPSAGSRAR